MRDELEDRREFKRGYAAGFAHTTPEFDVGDEIESWSDGYTQGWFEGLYARHNPSDSAG